MASDSGRNTPGRSLGTRAVTRLTPGGATHAINQADNTTVCGRNRSNAVVCVDYIGCTICCRILRRREARS